MAKQTKNDLIKLKKKLEKKIELIDVKLIELDKPAKIGFNYKNRVV